MAMRLFALSSRHVIGHFCTCAEKINLNGSRVRWLFIIDDLYLSLNSQLPFRSISAARVPFIFKQDS